jgi:8-oxo-dGTP diphosphatase
MSGKKGAFCLMSEGEHPRNPYLAVDVIIEMEGGIVLVERRNEPRGWALPGGFVDYGEGVEDAATREAKEETCLDVRLKELLYVYSRPDRDPRQHTTSVVFVGEAKGIPRGADDAREARVFPTSALPQPLCFDHAEIVEDYLVYLQTGKHPSPSHKQGQEHG